HPKERLAFGRVVRGIPRQQGRGHLLSNRNSATNGSSPNGKSVCSIVATATALPPHTITRDDVKYYMGRVFDIPDRRLEAMMEVVDNAKVHKRHAIFPIEYT